MRAVDAVLAELSAEPPPQILIFNKVDRLEDRIDLLHLRAGRDEPAVFVSAATGEGLDRLDALVREELDARSATVDLYLPLAEGARIAAARSLGVVLEEEVVDDDELRLRMILDEGALGSLERKTAGGIRVELVAPPRIARHPRDGEAPEAPAPGAGEGEQRAGGEGAGPGDAASEPASRSAPEREGESEGDLAPPDDLPSAAAPRGG